jgi:hypothetical protein
MRSSFLGLWWDTTIDIYKAIQYNYQIFSSTAFFNMIIRAYIHFFRFRYSQTIGVCRPTLPQLRRLPDELRLPLVFCATASDGQRQPLATTAALTMAARQPWNLWRRWLWWLLQRHRHRCLSWQRRLHLMAPLPRPLDRHRSELADDLTYNFPPHQASPTFVSPLAHSPPAAWTPWMTPRRSHLRSTSTTGRPDLCAASSASTSGGMDTVDDLQRSPLRSSSTAGRPDPRPLLAPPPPALWPPWMSS